MYTTFSFRATLGSYVFARLVAFFFPIYKVINFSYLCKKGNPRSTLTPNGRPLMRGRYYEVHGTYIDAVISYRFLSNCVVFCRTTTQIINERGANLAPLLSSHSSEIRNSIISRCFLTIFNSFLVTWKQPQSKNCQGKLPPDGWLLI